jgi:hypothetical protein
MAVRRPIVNIAGELSELPLADTLPGVGGDADPLILSDTAVNPAAPTSGIKLWAKNFGGKRLPVVSEPSGEVTPLQSSLWRRRSSFLHAVGNSSTVGAIGLNNATTGTITQRNVATTNLFMANRRLGFVTAATAGSNANIRQGAAVFWRGNAAGLGGFFFACRFGISDAAAVADARMFVGMSATTAAIGNVNPSTLLNSVGVATDNAQTTLRITTNDGSGTATAIDLGANFPANTSSVDLYEVTLYCAPNGADIKYRVERLNTGHVAEGTLTAKLPVNTVFMGQQVWRNNGATALAAAFDLFTIHVETPL